jgi:hypothetical protein
MYIYVEHILMRTVHIKRMPHCPDKAAFTPYDPRVGYAFSGAHCAVFRIRIGSGFNSGQWIRKDPQK